jgi:UDP-3-O-acyl-N-acetylglucosamine deacetylase
MLLQTQLCPAQSIAPSKDARTDKVTRKVLAPKTELTLRREDAFITFFPEGTQRLTYGIDHLKEAPIIGKQWFSWAPSEDKHYRWHIAPARTYAASLQVGLLVDVHSCCDHLCFLHTPSALSPCDYS